MNEYQCLVCGYIRWEKRYFGHCYPCECGGVYQLLSRTEEEEDAH